MADDTETIDSIATRQDRIESKLDQLLAAGSKPAPGEGSTPEGRPATVEEQVRAELQRAEDERTAAATQAAKEEEHQTMAQRLAKLEEAPPVQPIRRATKAMWGGR